MPYKYSPRIVCFEHGLNLKQKKTRKEKFELWLEFWNRLKWNMKRPLNEIELENENWQAWKQ